MDYSSCQKLIDILALNFKAMFSARVKVRKKDFCIALAEKQQKCRDRAPLSKDNVDNSKNFFFSSVPSRWASEMFANYPRIILEWAIWRKKQNENLSLSVHTTAMQLISGLERLRNVQKWKFLVQSFQTYCFLLSNMQICDIEKK